MAKKDEKRQLDQLSPGNLWTVNGRLIGTNDGERLELSPEDQRLALELLVHIRDNSDGRISEISDAEVDRIVWLRRAWPEMNLDDVWLNTYLFFRMRTPDEKHELDCSIARQMLNQQWGANQ